MVLEKNVRDGILMRVVIVEDNNEDAKHLTDCLNKFSKSHGVEFQIVRFDNANDFMAERKLMADLVFMDILMPGTDGMAAAEYFRKFDRHTRLIFVTNMAKYAIKGYSVDAIDFILKPVKYSDFEVKMRKVVELIRTDPDDHIVVTNIDGLNRISVRTLYYVEIIGHKLVYHTPGADVVSHGTLSKVEEQLRAYSFLRCNSCYLVNPKFIEAVDGFEIRMTNGDVLQISHPRKARFMRELAEWMGKGNFV